MKITWRSWRGLAVGLALAAPAAAHSQNVLWLGGASNYNSSATTLAAANGWTIDIWDASDPTPIFSNYHVLMTGSDWSGHDASLMSANKAAIEAARGSRTFLSGQDADYHRIYGSNTTAASLFMTNAVNWAAAGTGLGIVSLTTYWWSDPLSFLYSELSGNISSTGGNNVIIPAATAGFPVNAGLTSASLSNWGSSYHHTFSTTIPDYTIINLSGDSYCGAYCAVTIVTESEADGGTAIVPEPSTVVLMASGLFGVGIAALRRRRKI